MTTRTPAAGLDVLEQMRRILAGSADPAPSACCSSEKQQACCEPSQKASCCGTDMHMGAGCGCQ